LGSGPARQAFGLAISELIAKEDLAIAIITRGLDLPRHVGELVQFFQSLRKYPPIPQVREGGRPRDELERKSRQRRVVLMKFRGICAELIRATRANPRNQGIRQKGFHRDDAVEVEHYGSDPAAPPSDR